MKTFATILTFGLFLGISAAAMAQTATDLNNQATQMNTLAATQGQTKVINKTSSDFSSFLGSDSTAVVTGLRNGTPINLTRTQTTINPTTGAPVTTTTTTTITPPTGQMGHGEVYISLALAKQQLGTMGITEPTPEQLQAAMTGGSITQTTTDPTTGLQVTKTTEMQGILTMRSQNMGWGKIAQELGTKLGPVMSGMKRANQSLATTTNATAKGSAATSTTTSTTTKGSAAKSTTTTAKGKGSATTTASGSVSDSSNRQIVTGSGKTHGSSGQEVARGRSGSSSGIVTASGRSGGSGYGSSIVTGSGRSGGSVGRGIGGGGSGNGAGHGKGSGK
jgi:hypothetical protein